MKTTIGGDTLHQGKKMQVEIPGYGRSNCDLSTIFRSSMAPGTLVPCLVEIMLPGDTFDIKIDMDIKTLPTLGPLFGSFKAAVDVFTVPMRLYNNQIAGNYYNQGLSMSTTNLNTIQLLASQVITGNEVQINPSCILSYLGIRGIGSSEGGDQYRTFNATSLISYIDICRMYYINRQTQQFAYLHALPANLGGVTPTGYEVNGNNPNNDPTQIDGNTYFAISFSGTVTSTDWVNNFYIRINGNDYNLGSVTTNITIGLSVLQGTIVGFTQSIVTAIGISTGQAVDTAPSVYFDNIAELDNLITECRTNNGVDLGDLGINYIDNLLGTSSPYSARQISQEGLFLKQYTSDIFNNWLNTDTIQAINTMSRVSTLGNYFSIDALNFAKKVYQLMNSVALLGGSYSAWLQATYDIDNFYFQNGPRYEGSLVKEVVFQEVVSNTNTTTNAGEQPMGTLAGRGTMSNKHIGGNMVIKTNELCYLIAITHLTPRIDYSQGNRYDVNLLTFDDFHKPIMDGIGFQDVILEKMAWWDTKWDGTKWVQRSAGKQPAWMDYMTNFNRTYGNFALPEKEMYMTLNRRYEMDPGDNSIYDLSPYIDPMKYNFIFAQTSRDAQNFWTQIAFNIFARRKMSQKIIPTP